MELESCFHRRRAALVDDFTDTSQIYNQSIVD